MGQTLEIGKEEEAAAALNLLDELDELVNVFMTIFSDLLFSSCLDPFFVHPALVCNNS